MSGGWNYIDLEIPENFRKFIREALKYADCIGLSYSLDYSAFLESDRYNILSESIIRHKYSDRGELVFVFQNRSCRSKLAERQEKYLQFSAAGS